MSSKRFLAIVDPWANPPTDEVEKFPMLTSDNNIQCQLIHNQLSRLKPLFDDIIVLDNGQLPHSLFDELPSYGFGYESKYLSDKQDWDMWLCGFHDGRCIHDKIYDIIKIYGWNYSRFHIIQNLSFLFPGDMKRPCYQQAKYVDIAKNVKVYDWDYISNFYIGSNAIYTNGRRWWQL